MSLSLSELERWYRQREPEILRDFIAFLRFPSISTDAVYAEQMRHTADWLCSYLKKIGLQVELWETPGYPIVFATHHAGPDKPTVLIYQHYDVQPVDPIDLWTSPPFEPVIKQNKIYARGASDNKGQCFYSIQAIRVFLESAEKGEINIKLFIEGEEESGERGTMVALEERKAELKADYLFVVDFDLPAADIPAVTLGMRGIVAMQVECQNSATDLHSGLHGGIALSPNRALVCALARLWDENGRVTIPGFYEDVRSLSEKELALLDTEFDLEKYTNAFGVKAFAMEEGYTPKEANWLRPTLELNGIYGGYSGAGFKTVIPAKAGAKISCRLVPDQDPEKIARSIAHFLTEEMPEGIEVQVDIDHGAAAYRAPPYSTAIREVAAAFEEVMGKPCSYILNGASVPIAGHLAAASGAETALMGVALPGDDIHAPNEHFGLDRFERGIYIMARALYRLAHAKTS